MAARRLAMRPAPMWPAGQEVDLIAQFFRGVSVEK
jgi:hypothetical protein